VRWQPLDPKYIGAVLAAGTYTGSVSCAAADRVVAAGQQSFPLVSRIQHAHKARPKQHNYGIITGNPLLQPETAYEWSAG